jgi:hypothetical protein
MKVNLRLFVSAFVLFTAAVGLILFAPHLTRISAQPGKQISAAESDEAERNGILEQILENTEWNFLNRLKRLPDKSAFFYWYKTLEILEI